MRAKIWFIHRPGLRWGLRRLLLLSPWEDVAIQISDHVYGVDRIQGVISYDFKEFDRLHRNKTWTSIDITDTDSIVGFLNDQLSKPEDRTALIPFYIGRDYSSSRAWYSSELITKALVYSNVVFCPLTSRITPRRLWSLLPTVIVAN